MLQLLILVALARVTISWIIHMNKQGYYPYDSVETSSGSSGKTKLLFTHWLNLIDENFEKEFWIDESNSSEFVNRKQIYKDTVNSTPLKQVETILLGKYEIKTPDSSDYNYVGDYYNDDDSHDYKRAHGFNYHNEPEWLWLTGLPEPTNADGRLCPYSCCVLAWSAATLIETLYDLIRS
ncbi:unnamed protein product [Rotaria sp. Silwood1]|nr:unnamed protein product [Rotaria sp. Silwood1]